MKLWRIAAETRDYAAADLRGTGAARYPGRWNDHGEAVVYCAPAVAMAVLETAAHVDDAGLPLNRYLVEIEVPDSVWEQREAIQVAALPFTWDAIPAGRASVNIGSEWLTSRRSAILSVPSVIAPEESIALINPAHASVRSLRGKAVRAFDYNKLFRR